MFVDRIKIFAQAGQGGRGACSFRREKFVPRGGPDGGDGGRGGDIILKADKDTDNLTALFYEPILKAKNGAHGKGKQMYGRAAISKIVKVPIGTLVYHAERPPPKTDDDPVEVVGRARRPRAAVAGEVVEGEEKVESDLGAHSEASSDEVAEPLSPEPIADLAHDGEEYVLCAGGAGGKGNVHFKSSKNRAPVQYTEGGEGEEGYFLFELRTIADAGLVGYPNAGKSTLLSRISAAHPKIAPYPFTTLHPSVGVVDLSGYHRVTVADIPGLIEGAHRNLGLGHDFLRHITRCRLLIFVLDAAGSEGRNPVEDLQTLRRELDLYDARLSKRPWFVVANKMDLPEAEENMAALQQRFPAVKIIGISAEQRTGLEELRRHLDERLSSDELQQSRPDSAPAESAPINQ